MSEIPRRPFAGTVLVVDDVAANRELLRQMLEPHGYEILAAPDGTTALKVAQRGRPELILMDVIMPGSDGFETCRRLRQAEGTRDIPVIFITALDEPAAVVEGFRAGGVDFITRPFQPEATLARVQTHLEKSRLTRDLLARNEELRLANETLVRERQRRERVEESLERVDGQLSLVSRQEALRWGLEALVGRSPALGRLLAEVRKLQSLPATPVLITGESGTGKELIARAIHFGGARGRAPFLAVNCCAVPDDLAESLFFGHARGAFSGAARDEKGYFASADGGTLFLDEIGDMSLALQAKLLRVLEGGVILPVGADHERRVDVRIVAATNSDPQHGIAEGTFRSDLYFRLAHVVLEVPPVRERRDDIPLLAAHFLEVLGTEMGMHPPRLSPASLATLDRYDYPGNVRELKNLIERALIESGGADIQPEHLHFAFPPGPAAHPDVRRGIDALATPHGDSHDAAPVPDGTRHPDEERIVDYVRTHGSINNTRCRDLLGVGMHRAWYLLRCLHRGGVLRQEGTGRWASYRLA